MQNENMICFDRVSFSYGKKRIIEDFSLEVPKGGRICFYGESGCGKSTLLRLVCGLEKPTGGNLTVGSRNIRMSFQEDRLLPFLTVKENVTMFASEKDADEVIARLSLTEAANEYPAKLSGGMARRASLARALAGSADIYIFDEPFNGLDEDNIRRASELINERTAGKTVLAVLHERSYAELIGCGVVEVKRTRSLLS